MKPAACLLAGVPSAGDWVPTRCFAELLMTTIVCQALDRFGAVFLQGTQGFKIDNCEFERLDGNAVMVRPEPSLACTRTN